MGHEAEVQPSREPASEVSFSHVLACVTILLMPFPLVLKGLGNPSLSYDYNTIIFPVDVAFLALIVAGAPAVARRVLERRSGAGAALWMVLSALMAVAWLAHPSGRGVHTLLELWGSAVLMGTISEALDGAARPLLVGVVAIVACGETVWSGLQIATKSNLGLHRLGEANFPFLSFTGNELAPMGSMVHIYVLCGLALVGAGTLVVLGLPEMSERRWLLAVTVAIVPVGYTYSRAGIVGGALLVAALAIGLVSRSDRGNRRRFGLAASALAVGIAVPAAIWHGGWTSRLTQTTTATSASQLTTERGTLTHEAISQIRTNPVLGVGPGRYVMSLKDRFHHESDPSVQIFKPVHNVPLLLAAEGGILAGATFGALLLIVGRRALTSGPAAVGLYLAYLPFILLDHFPYSFPQGLVITAIWIGTLDTSWAHRRAVTATKA